MKKIFFILFFSFIWLLWSCRRENTEQTGNQILSIKKNHYFHPHQPLVKLENTKILDTFTLWRDLYRLLEINDSLNEEELKDKLKLVHDKIIHIQRQKFPPELDTSDIKSRLLLLQNENLQLQWILDKKYVYPSADSIFQRYIAARNGLFNQINFLASDTVNYERIFREKARRDKEIENIFKNTNDSVNQKPDAKRGVTSVQIFPVEKQR